RDLMRELLSPLGFTVMTAVDGPNCLEMMELVAADIFFADIRMPGMSGWELVTALRERGVAQPIVMLSANIGDGAGQSSDAGHTDTLAKPFDLKQVLDKLGTLVGIEWDYAEGAAKPPTAGRMRSPGPEHLRDLASLGQIGHVRGIVAKLTELDADPDNLPLVEAF